MLGSLEGAGRYRVFDILGKHPAFVCWSGRSKLLRAHGATPRLITALATKAGALAKVEKTDPGLAALLRSPAARFVKKVIAKRLGAVIFGTGLLGKLCLRWYFISISLAVYIP